KTELSVIVVKSNDKLLNQTYPNSPGPKRKTNISASNTLPLSNLVRCLLPQPRPLMRFGRTSCIKHFMVPATTEGYLLNIGSRRPTPINFHAREHIVLCFNIGRPYKKQRHCPSRVQLWSYHSLSSLTIVRGEISLSCGSNTRGSNA